jgi:hypothetical protein
VTAISFREPERTLLPGTPSTAVEPDVSTLLPLSRFPKREPARLVKYDLQHSFEADQTVATRRPLDDRMSGAMEQTEGVGIAVIKGALGGEGPTAEALVMKVAKQRVGGKEEEELARAIQHETRVNMHRRIVAELQIHLSLNQLRSEQCAGEDEREKDSD